MSMMNPLASVLLFVLAISGSCAQDTPDTITAPVISSSRPSLQPSQSPFNAPVVTPAPTDFECSNTAGWYFEFSAYSNCSWNIYQLDCDDERVECWDYGNFGPASFSCCKCKSQCIGQCNDPISTVDTTINDDDNTNCYIERDDDFVYTYRQNDDEGIPILFGIGMVILCFMSIGLHQCNRQGQHDARREANRQTMVARRAQQRQSNSQGLTAEERNHARYELFLSKFHFQTVLPDKSNISASSLRNVRTNPDEENANEELASDTPPKRSLSRHFSKASLSIRQLSSWRRTSTKDECCICLESYSVGETICAAITKECDHVYHEGCMLQWVKNNDKCPLCRVDLLKD